MNNETRNKRKSLIGTVTSRSGNKSVKVTVAYKIPHPRYTKVINRKTVLHVHDENDETKVGDKVVIMETRPISKLKRWRVLNVAEAAPVVEEIAAATAEAIEGGETK